MLTSGHGVEIIGNVFHNLCANNNLLFLNGMCAFWRSAAPTIHGHSPNSVHAALLCAACAFLPVQRISS